MHDRYTASIIRNSFPTNIEAAYAAFFCWWREAFLLPAPEMIPFSRAEPSSAAFQADLAPFSRAGGYISPFQAGSEADFCAECCHLPFRAGNDTLFPRRTVSSGIPGGFGTLFPRRRLQKKGASELKHPFLYRLFFVIEILICSL